MTESVLLDAAGRRRSPAMLPGYHAGRAPRHKGQNYPADPPTVEEIVAVIRQTADDRHGYRVRALIVVLWRAGLRGQEALIGDRVIPPALAGKAASVMGDPDMPHTYTFIPDIGENLVRLGGLDEALGGVWHLPSPETRTTRQVVALVYQAAGTDPRLKVTPAWQMRALGLVNRTVREINEMRYEFDEPFIVDASRATTELGLHATPLADAVEQTVRWYRQPTSPVPAQPQKSVA